MLFYIVSVPWLLLRTSTLAAMQCMVGEHPCIVAVMAPPLFSLCPCHAGFDSITKAVSVAMVVRNSKAASTG